MPRVPKTNIRGRPKGTFNHERAKDLIRTSVIVERMNRVALGEIEATANQVAAARLLLGKVMADQQATDITSGGEAMVVERVQFVPLVPS